MAGGRQLPCNLDGVCMLCKSKPSEAEKLICIKCFAQWHASCLAVSPQTSAAMLHWKCPVCITDMVGPLYNRSVGKKIELLAEIHAIEEDPYLSKDQKAKRRQDLVFGHDRKGKSKMEEEAAAAAEEESVYSYNDSNTLDFDEHIHLPERPVTTRCGHNFCDEGSGDDRPAFIRKRGKTARSANASTADIFMNVPSDHFGPITAENDPLKRGVKVGDCFDSRMEARQWGVHLAPISGISGQSKTGAQSVVLSGGYEDDKDCGDWFLYTGSGGRDLSGNKRTNKTQSKDQDFVKCNESLRQSCMHGYPVRVIRAHKDKHSRFAPEKGYRYDGIYRIERCWRIVGTQGFIICQYLFVRCDNEPAPWNSEKKRGDIPRHLPYIANVNEAVDFFERKQNPSWDFDVFDFCWKWKKPPPPSKTVIASRRAKNRKRERENEQSLEKFTCVLCRELLKQPMTTPCGHNFCKACLEPGFTSQSSRIYGRTLAVQKNTFLCPHPRCPDDISDFLDNPQVNTKLAYLIEKFQHRRERIVETSYFWDMEEADTNNGSDDEETI